MGNKYEFDPEIDDQRLDWEWTRQPEMVYRTLRELAEAKKAHEEARRKIDVVRAELAAEIRKTPDRYGVVKVTENSVEEAILVQPEYTEIVKAAIEARYEMDLLQAAADALDHKKKALENLVFLHGQNYFAEPQAKPENREVMGKVKRDSAFRRRGNDE